MPTVCELASTVKSANAGASQITLEVELPDAATFERVAAADPLDTARIGELYGVAPESVSVFYYRPALTIKVTIPRSTFTSQLSETDFDGVQQHVPLLGVRIELEDAVGPARR